MKRRIALALFIPLLFINRCTEESPLISENELVVVEAYLYAGELVDDIKLMGTLPLDADTNAVPPPLNDAVVRLIRNNVSYELELMAGDSGYYHYAGDDLAVQTGDQFILEIEWQGQFISAETTIPEKPINVSLSKTNLEVPNFDDRESIMEWMQSEDRDIILSWENDSTQFFYVVLENIDNDPEPIESSFGPRFRGFITQPINDNEYPIRAMMLTHLGNYRVHIFRVNPEYVDLYESRNQDSRDLNEPLTNIVNGLGVFTAFNSETRSFTVTQ